MKVKVIEPFADKYTGKMHYAGDVLDWDDEARIADCGKRNLVQELETEKPKKVTKKAKQQ